MSDLAATKERLAEAMELERLRERVAELEKRVKRLDHLAGMERQIAQLERTPPPILSIDSVFGYPFGRPLV